jgi:predicted DNA-binding helix-hairpin-helix protein
MDTQKKLQILSDASQYDLACACGTIELEHRKRAADGTWLYPVALPSGGYSIMLKTLLSSVCANDCKYCPCRSTVDIQRCTLAPHEIAAIFMDYVRTKNIFGLFLSSGVVGTPDHTMELLNASARILRRKHGFRGYIHLKIIPGASDAAVEESLSLASAVSINIETPGREHFSKLSTTKDYDRDIIRPLKLISKLTAQGMKYSRIKKTTQFVVGAADERDREIVKYMYGLYNRLRLNRVYFSAYQRGLGTDIPGERRVEERPDYRFIREHRIYQVDFLLRKYRFTEEDILFDRQGNLSLDKDPKRTWAEQHPQFFPVSVNVADKYELLRVPGLGPVTVNTILRLRSEQRIRGTDMLPLKGKQLTQAKAYLAFD